VSLLSFTLLLLQGCLLSQRRSRPTGQGPRRG
jgi:hypothetical protein